MTDISGGRVGGRIEDLHLVQADLEAAGAGARAHVAAVSGRVDRLDAEVGDLTTAMKADFAELASQLAQQCQKATSTLAAADWDGRSRGAAEAANAQFGADIDTALASAAEGADALGQALLSQVLAFYSEVNGSFGTIMSNIEANYSDLALGTRRHAEMLANQDAVGIRFG